MHLQPDREFEAFVLATESNHSFSYVLREDIQLRFFSDSTVAFHSDSGDTFVVDALSASILRALLLSKAPLGFDDIKTRVPTVGPSLESEEQSALEISLATLEYHDLVRVLPS